MKSCLLCFIHVFCQQKPNSHHLHHELLCVHGRKLHYVTRWQGNAHFKTRSRREIKLKVIGDSLASTDKSLGYIIHNSCFTLSKKQMVMSKQYLFKTILKLVKICKCFIISFGIYRLYLMQRYNRVALYIMGVLNSKTYNSKF